MSNAHEVQAIYDVVKSVQVIMLGKGLVLVLLVS